MGLGDALHVAGAAGRLKAVDFRFDWSQTYTFWSGLLGGLFLMLSYFGCDQSQVQRYLTAKSVDEGRDSLMMSAFVKIPLQALVLLTGVLVFVFYLFQQPPMLFNTVHAEKVEKSARAGEFHQLESEFASAFEARRTCRGGAGGGGDDGTEQAARATFAATDQVVSGIARPGRTAGARGHRRRPLQGSDRRHAGAGRQLRLSDVRHDQAAARAGRADHRRDLRRRDVVALPRSSTRWRRRASSTSTAGSSSRRRATRTT